MHRQERSESRSRISYSSHRGTQTDLTHPPGYYSEENVILPCGLFNAMARSYYSRHSQGKSIGTMTDTTTTNIAVAQCQTDFSSDSGEKVIRQPVTDDFIVLSGDEGKQTATTITGNSSEMLNEPTGEVRSIATLDNSNLLSDESAIQKKTTHGKQPCFDCFVVIQRLTPQNIRSFDISSGQLNKIPMKTYMERKQVIGERQESKSTMEKRPALSIDPKVNTKASVGQDRSTKNSSVVSQKPTGESNKRKESGEQDSEKSKQTKTSRSREVYQSLARSIEALVDADNEAESVPGQDDLQQWCLEKVVHLVEKYKNKSVVKSNSNRH